MSDNFEMRLGHLLNPRTKQNQKKNVEEASKWLVIGIYIYTYGVRSLKIKTRFSVGVDLSWEYFF